MAYRAVGLLAVLVVAACGDPAGPRAHGVGQVQRPLASLSYLTGDVPQIPNVYTPPNQAADACANALNGTQYIWSIQRQRLIWDDPVGRLSNGVVMEGTLKILFRGWRGTWNGQRLECVRLEQAYMNRYLFNNISNIAQPATEWNITLPRIQVCYGEAACTQYPPRVYVEVYVRYKYTYNIDVAVSTGQNVLLELGGVETLATPNAWKVELWPSGFWQAYDYGGNNGHKYGWWQWGPTGYWIPGKYYWNNNPTSYALRSGSAHWALD